jgi:hypothetical protein
MAVDEMDEEMAREVCAEEGIKIEEVQQAHFAPALH